jgi:hypothetical protein
LQSTIGLGLKQSLLHLQLSSPQSEDLGFKGPIIKHNHLSRVNDPSITTHQLMEHKEGAIVNIILGDLCGPLSVDFDKSHRFEGSFKTFFYVLLQIR